MNTVKLLCAAALAAGIAGSANAALYFSDPNGSPIITDTDGVIGISDLDVSFASTPSVNIRNIGNPGLGTFNYIFSIDDTSEISSFSLGTLNPYVTINSQTATTLDFNVTTTPNYFGQNIRVAQIIFNYANVGTRPDDDVSDFSLTSNSLAFGVIDGVNGLGTLSVVDAQTPLPAGALLLGTGLVIMAARRRRS